MGQSSDGTRVCRWLTRKQRSYEQCWPIRTRERIFEDEYRLRFGARRQKSSPRSRATTESGHRFCGGRDSYAASL